MIVRIFYFLTAIISITVLVACSQPMSQDYFPLASGYEWSYRRTLKLEGDVWPTEDVFRITNLGLTNDVSLPATKVFSRLTSDGTQYYLRAQETKLTRIAKKTVVEQVPFPDPEPRTILPTGDELKQGALWTLITPSYVLRSRPNSSAEFKAKQMEMVFEIVSTDAKVDVPAGRFAKCVLVRGTSMLRLYADARVGYKDIPVTQEEWYAPGVGLVKLVRTEPLNGTFFIGGTLTLELAEFSH